MTTRRRLAGTCGLLAIVVIACGGGSSKSIAASTASSSASGSARVVVVLAFTDSLDDGALDSAVSILRKRVDRLGLANPEIVRSGQQLTVRFDGVAADPKTVDALTRTAVLEFRPLCALLPTGLSSSAYAQAIDPVSGGSCVQPSAGGSAPAGPVACAVPGAGDAPGSGSQAILAPEDSDRNGTIDDCLVVGPAQLTNSAVIKAEAAQPAGAFVVELTLADGALERFNALSSACFEKTDVCPAGRTAIVLDGAVVSAPAPQTPVFTSTLIQISGNFTEAQAKDLAVLLSAGALPARLEVVSITPS